MSQMVMAYYKKALFHSCSYSSSISQRFVLLSQCQRRNFTAKLQTQPKNYSTNIDNSTQLSNSLKSTESQSSIVSEERNRLLKFVKERSNLKQVFFRSPNDGMFPIIKSPQEYTVSDIQQFIKNQKRDPFPLIVENLTKDSPSNNEEFITKFLSLIYDKEADLGEKLYYKMKKEDIEIIPVMYNYFLLNAVQFNNHKFMMQLLFEMTITDISVDLNTYLKLFQCLYFDADIRFDRKEFLIYLYQLFAKDHNKEVFEFGTELFQEYLDSNLTQFNQLKEKTKKKGSKKHTQPDQQSQKDYYHHSTGSSKNKQAYQEPSDIDSDQLSEDLKLDQLNDLFQNRNNLYRNQMNRTKINLRKHNNKKQNLLNMNQSSRHVQKYQQMQGYQKMAEGIDNEYYPLTDRSALVVELGQLKDIEMNPSNIKEISKIMAEQIANLLENKLGSQSGDEKPQTEVFQLNILPVKNNKWGDKDYSKGKSENKFSLNQFYGKESEETSQNVQSDKYITTQEEFTTESVNQTQRASLATNSQLSQQESTMSKNYESENEKEDLLRRNIIREELNENDKSKLNKEDNATTTADEKGGPRAGGARHQ